MFRKISVSTLNSLRMPSKKPRFNPQAWSLYPHLHATVSQLLQDTNLSYKFHRDDNSNTCIKEYDTNIMGEFTCKNAKCSSDGWGSKKIAVTIRMYPGQKYNARVYFQRCRKCKRLSKPTLDGSYAERIAYRLKRWNGLAVEVPEYSEDDDKPPHQSHLCEGCKDGHCRFGGWD